MHGFEHWAPMTSIDPAGPTAGEPVSEEYHVPFDFTGKIGKVVVKLGSGD